MLIYGVFFTPQTFFVKKLNFNTKSFSFYHLLSLNSPEKSCGGATCVVDAT